MKKIVNRIGVVLCIVATLVASVDLYRFCMSRSADCFVRVAFRGLENMFRLQEYDYYAVNGNHSTKIPKRYAPDEILYDPDENIYADDQYETWIVSLNRTDPSYGSGIMGDGYETSPLGENLYLSWDLWGNDTEPNENDIEVFRKFAETFYKKGGDEWYQQLHDMGSGEGLERGMVFRYNDIYILVNDRNDCLYRVNKKGKIKKVMKCPSKGVFDDYWFR